MLLVSAFHGITDARHHRHHHRIKARASGHRHAGYVGTLGQTSNHRLLY